MWIPPFLAKRLAIKKFGRTLRRDAVREHGEKRFYSPKEIEAVFLKYHYHREKRYWCYGFSMMCNQVTFSAYHLERGEICDYNQMRQQCFDLIFASSEGLSGGHAMSDSYGGDGGGGSD